MVEEEKWIEELKKFGVIGRDIENCSVKAKELGLDGEGYEKYMGLCKNFGEEIATGLWEINGGYKEKVELLQNSCNSAIVDNISSNLSEDEKEHLLTNCIIDLFTKIQDEGWRKRYLSRYDTYLAHISEECSESEVCYTEKGNEYKKFVFYNEALDFIFPDFKSKSKLNYAKIKPLIKPYKLNKNFLRTDLEMQERLKTLIAYLISDGSMIINLDSNISRIEFNNASPVLLNKFIDIVKDIVPHANIIIEEKPEAEGTFRIHINSKELCEVISELTPSARTKAFANDEDRDRYLENKIFPDIVKKFNISEDTLPIGEFYFSYKDKNGVRKVSNVPIIAQFPHTQIPILEPSNLKKEILQIFADTEGSVTCNVYLHKREHGPEYNLLRNMSIANTHPGILRQLFELLSELGFSPAIEKGKKVNLVGSDIDKFESDINFSKDVEVFGSPYYYGNYRRSILALSNVINLLASARKIHFENLGKDNMALNEVLNQGIELFNKEDFNKFHNYLINKEILTSRYGDNRLMVLIPKYIESRSEQYKTEILDILKVGSINHSLSKAVDFYENRVVELEKEKVDYPEQIAKKELAKYLCNLHDADLMADEKEKIVNQCNNFINTGLISLREKVINLLQNEVSGLTSREIIEKLNINPKTIISQLARLEKEGSIYYRPVPISEERGVTARKYFYKIEGRPFEISQILTTEQKIINLLSDKGNLTSKKIQIKLKMSESQIDRNLNKLVAKGIINYKIERALIGKPKRIYFKI